MPTTPLGWVDLGTFAGKKCPRCQTDFATSAIICVQCGIHLESYVNGPAFQAALQAGIGGWPQGMLTIDQAGVIHEHLGSCPGLSVYITRESILSLLSLVASTDITRLERQAKALARDHEFAPLLTRAGILPCLARVAKELSIATQRFRVLRGLNPFDKLIQQYKDAFLAFTRERINYTARAKAGLVVDDDIASLRAAHEAATIVLDLINRGSNALVNQEGLRAEAQALRARVQALPLGNITPDLHHAVAEWSAVERCLRSLLTFATEYEPETEVFVARKKRGTKR